MVSIAGRIRAIRNSGMFIDVHDHTGKIQIFNYLKNLEPGQRTFLSNLDVGDFVHVRGVIRRTRAGELSINASEVTLLTKSLHPLPDKHAGLTDTETRLRERYLDVLTNPVAAEVIRARTHLYAALRGVLNANDFLEVETPILHPIPSGARAQPFVTQHNALGESRYLRIAPELYLKRLLVAQISNRLFEISRNFRNEGLSFKHNPEFTMLEAYMAFADYQEIMDLTEEMLKESAKVVTGGLTFQFGDNEIDFSGNWPRKTMLELIAENTGVDFSGLNDEEAKRAIVDLEIENTDALKTWGECVQAVFESKIEKGLIGPIHVIDYPIEISPLAKTHRRDPRLVERFETYIGGLEVCDGFTELNDPRDQMERFREQMRKHALGDEEALVLDQDFIKALEIGMPPAGGVGIGIDRLLMILKNQPNIREVLAFPDLRRKEI
ncbi:lysine--tRNA ligase [Candidatus Peregrinibacteria bacterium]|nr:lysine--tRNA ligase [Candidatus Peregrinibacteria bacterium]